MARSRAERRHNTHVKTSARKAKAIRVEIDQLPNHGYCGGKISLNGEAISCSLCETCKRYERNERARWEKAQVSAFMLAIN